MMWWDYNPLEPLVLKDGFEFTRWVLKPERVIVRMTENGFFLEVIEDEEEPKSQ
jgi:hypothetical protein